MKPIPRLSTARRQPFYLASVAIGCVVLGGILAGGFPRSAAGCDTPVYRYAMYRWTSAYYAVFYLHDAPTPDDVAAAHAQLKALAEDEARPSNIELIDVDMSQENAADRLPAIVRDTWTERDEKRLPAYVLLTPQWETFPLETLDAATVEAMVDSPARRELVGLLDKGQTMAFVLLTGEDDEANKKAENQVNEVIRLIATGQGGPPPPGVTPQLPYSTPPPNDGEAANGEQADGEAANGEVADGEQANGEVANGEVADGEPETEKQPADGQAGAKPQHHEVGLVKVRRDDPAEAWFVKCLLGVESDLPTLTEPMVFGIYGRGRALPPCVGPGINKENLMEYVWFITGPCSCTVKEQNPGVDLLVRSNWDAAAKAMSDRFGAEEGNPYQYGGVDLFTELLIPADGAEEPARPEPDTVATAEDGDANGQGQGQEDALPVSLPATDATGAAGDVATETPNGPDAAADDDDAPGAAPAERDMGTLSTVPSDAAEDASPEPEPGAAISPITTVGTGIVVVVVLLGAVTMLLARKL